MSLNHNNRHRVNEDSFLFDFFRCAARIGGFAAIANYNLFKSLKNDVERKAVFVAQQIVLLNAYEDFAIFLNAVNKRKNDISILETMAKGEDSLTEFPNILRKLQKPAEFLEWLGIDENQLIKKLREKSGNSQRQIEKIVKKRIYDLIDGIKKCRKHKTDRAVVYNKAKHGKPILSTNPDLIFECGKTENLIHFVAYNNLAGGLESKTIPFSIEQFETITKNIIRVSDAMRDLIFFIVAQFHPSLIKTIEQEYYNQVDFRQLTSELWQECSDH